MASERYQRLHELLSRDASDPVGAMVTAGWPLELARGLGAMALRLLAKAGLPLDEPLTLTAPAPLPVAPTDPGAAVSVDEHDPADRPRRGRPRAESKED